MVLKRPTTKLGGMCFLTISQFARIALLNHDTASKQLRRFEERGLLGFFGNTGIRGYGKTPKTYFLTRKGFELLRRESEIPPELIGPHKEVKVESRWSPQMYHRLRTVDLMISAECAVRIRPQLSIVATFLEYRRVRRGNHVRRLERLGYSVTLQQNPMPGVA